MGMGMGMVEMALPHPDYSHLYSPSDLLGPLAYRRLPPMQQLALTSLENISTLNEGILESTRPPPEWTGDVTARGSSITSTLEFRLGDCLLLSIPVCGLTLPLVAAIHSTESILPLVL